MNMPSSENVLLHPQSDQNSNSSQFVSFDTIINALKRHENWSEYDQTQIAALFNMSRQNVYNYTSSEGRLPWANIADFCLKYGFHFDELIYKGELVPKTVKSLNSNLSSLRNDFIQKGGFIYKLTDWSMEPTLYKDDHLMIMPMQEKTIHAGIYLLKTESGEYQVKRLYHRLDVDLINVDVDHKNYKDFLMQKDKIFPMIQGYLVGVFRTNANW